MQGKRNQITDEDLKTYLGNFHFKQLMELQKMLNRDCQSLVSEAVEKLWGLYSVSLFKRGNR